MNFKASFFPLALALKYLLPKKKQLSVTLIAVLSVTVISLVVWLVLVFLSVTGGIEENWLKRLTAVHAPLRITPTDAYYDSYYYKIDSISEASGYRYKSIGEKALAPQSDPYDPEEDSELPTDWPTADRSPTGSLVDPVKSAFTLLTKAQESFPDLCFQEYEISGALMRLKLSQKKSPLLPQEETETWLTQVTYVTSFNPYLPSLKTLLIPPTLKEIHSLFSKMEGDFTPLLYNIKIHEVRTQKEGASSWIIPPALLPENTPFFARMRSKGKTPQHVVIPVDPSWTTPLEENGWEKGELRKVEGALLFQSQEGGSYQIEEHIPLTVDQPLSFQVELRKESYAAPTLEKICFHAKGMLQKKPIEGIIPWKGIEIIQADIITEYDKSPLYPPPWVYTVYTAKKGELCMHLPSHPKGASVLLTQSLQESGLQIGDEGYLSYTLTHTNNEEQKLPIFVAGFYDPGILAMGQKCILAPLPQVHALSCPNPSHPLSKTLVGKEANGIQVWFRDIHSAKKIQAYLQKAFQETGIASYWNITSFEEYDFAKDLLQQFQSDKYLFTLIGILILTVACCNIISLLILLVSDKKKEIGILLAMGATPRSIAGVFSLCGVIMGLVSSLIGVGAAFFTLRHIDQIVRFLSFVQGHEAFNALFYGKSLPDKLSSQAVLFALIATPLLSFLAGLVPALKACRLKPSTILRSE